VLLLPVLMAMMLVQEKKAPKKESKETKGSKPAKGDSKESKEGKESKEAAEPKKFSPSHTVRALSVLACIVAACWAFHAERAVMAG
jgi:hypothetical protein